MTKEEIEKESKKWVKENTRTEHSASFGDIKVEPSAEKGYLAGAEPREKRIAELEQKIEKIKRYLDCEYCEHYTQPCGCKNCNEEIRSDWKLKEIQENDKCKTIYS